MISASNCSQRRASARSACLAAASGVVTAPARSAAQRSRRTALESGWSSWRSWSGQVTTSALRVMIACVLAFHGGVAGELDLTDHLARAACRLRRRGRAAGEHRARGVFRVDGIALAALAAIAAVRPPGFNDFEVVAAQEPHETLAVRPAALDPEALGRSQRPHPAEQLRVAAGIRGDRDGAIRTPWALSATATWTCLCVSTPTTIFSPQWSCGILRVTAFLIRRWSLGVVGREGQDCEGELRESLLGPPHATARRRPKPEHRLRTRLLSGHCPSDQPVTASRRTG